MLRSKKAVMDDECNDVSEIKETPSNTTTTKSTMGPLKGFKKFQMELARRKLEGTAVRRLQPQMQTEDEEEECALEKEFSNSATPTASVTFQDQQQILTIRHRSGGGGGGGSGCGCGTNNPTAPTNCNSIHNLQRYDDEPMACSSSIAGVGVGGSALRGHVSNSTDDSMQDAHFMDPEEWVLHTSCLDDSSDLLHECCCHPESMSNPEDSCEDTQQTKNPANLKTSNVPSVTNTLGRIRSRLSLLQQSAASAANNNISTVSVVDSNNKDKCHVSSSESDITPHTVIYNVVAHPLPPPPGSPALARHQLQTLSSSYHHLHQCSSSDPSSNIYPPPLEWSQELLANKNTNEELSGVPSSSAANPNRHIISQHHLSQSQLQLTKQRKQWETELDLIVPVTEQLSWPSNQSKMQVFDKGSTKHLNKFSGHKGISYEKQQPQLLQQQSATKLTHSESSLTPESRMGSSVKISQSSTSTRVTTRKRLFCDGFELDIRQLCLVCGVVIVGAALCVAIGVPIAFEMQSQQMNGFRHDLVRKLLAEVPLIDGHNDLAWNLRKFLQNQLKDLNFNSDLRQMDPFAGSAWSQTDLIRLREGGVGAQLWSAYVPCSAQHLDAVQIAIEQIDVIRRLVEKYPTYLSLVASVKDVERAHQERRIASLIGVEGGHAIGNSLAVLRMLYNLGARYLTLTHNCNTPWADSASSENYLPERNGLTEFGKLVVFEMNRLGMIVDLAHVSTQTMKDALLVSRAPVIFSHSAASALCNHSRNVPDDVLKLVAAKGGVVMVSFYNVFVACNETATIQDVVAHIEHIREVAGVDHVGIGAGFDGINFVPTGLEDVSKYPHLIEELLKDDTWSEQDLKKLVGINFLRVFRQVESVIPRPVLTTALDECSVVIQYFQTVSSKPQTSLLPHHHQHNNLTRNTDYQLLELLQEQYQTLVMLVGLMKSLILNVDVDLNDS